MQINKEWLSRQLNALHKGVNVLDKIEIFNQHVNDALHTKLSHPKWTVAEFLVLSIAFHIAEELYKPDLYWCEHKDLIPIKWLLHNDVTKIVGKFYRYYIEKLIFLSTISQSKEMNNYASAIEWLELAESSKRNLYIDKEILCYKITDEEPLQILEETLPAGSLNLVAPRMAKLIRMRHYNINEKIADKGIFPVLWLNADEASELLNFSQDQLIAQCIMDDFGAYLKIGNFTIKQFSNSSINRANVSTLSEVSYIHHYQGLVRLLKTSALHPDTTLEKIYEGADISVPYNEGHILVPIQPSVTECVQGISKYIELRQDQRITIDDLVFIKNEITKNEATLPDTEENEDSALIKQITTVYLDSPKKSPKPMWFKLKQLVDDLHITIITDMDDWSETEARLYYKGSSGRELSMGRKRFQNIISAMHHSV